MIGESLFGHLVHTFHLEQGMSGILSFGQTIGKEENRGTCEYLRLLQRIFP